ncbi:hypothetical protein ACFXP7_13345 [Microbacterium sp. P06]|uniref:hypothetical protein n=1 Tax=Microbacterium sp. P06 TaxID=3366949 RepID=UPI0037474C59
MAAGETHGWGYWAGQIIACAVLGAGAIAGGIVIIAVSGTGESEAGVGEGVVSIIVGIAFLVTLVWVVRKWVTSSKEQRAVYAWAIMQQQGARRNASPAMNDARAMSIAAAARDGELTAADIANLQALRPEVPFPGTHPSEP